MPPDRSDRWAVGGAMELGMAIHWKGYQWCQQLSSSSSNKGDYTAVISVQRKKHCHHMKGSSYLMVQTNITGTGSLYHMLFYYLTIV